MKNKHYIVSCDAGEEAKVNPGYQHYFRLYTKNANGIPVLVEQGLGAELPRWEKQYGAVYSLVDDVNPYPDLD